LIIRVYKNTFRTRRGRQSKPKEIVDSEPEVVDDEEVVELTRVDEESAEIVHIIEKKKKNDNIK
jgi:hypothetical protein